MSLSTNFQELLLLYAGRIAADENCPLKPHNLLGLPPRSPQRFMTNLSTTRKPDGQEIQSSIGPGSPSPHAGWFEEGFSVRQVRRCRELIGQWQVSVPEPVHGTERRTSLGGERRP